MARVAVRPAQIGHVSLRVRNLDRSVDFYRRLFGLYPRQAEPPSAVVRICTSPDNGTRAGVAVVLTEGLPAGSELTGMDHFSLIVPTKEAVNEAYSQAQADGVRATEPRVYAGHYQTFIFDPDGYKIELRAARCNGASTDAAQ